jgi:hypothetical protein
VPVVEQGGGGDGAGPHRVEQEALAEVLGGPAGTDDGPADADRVGAAADQGLGMVGTGLPAPGQQDQPLGVGRGGGVGQVRDGLGGAGQRQVG